MHEASKHSETRWFNSNWWKSLPWSCDYSPAQLEKSSLVSRFNFPKYSFKPFDIVFRSRTLKLAAIRPLALDVQILGNNDEVTHRVLTDDLWADSSLFLIFTEVCMPEWGFFFISTSVKAAKFKISPLLIALCREQLFMLIPKYLLRYQVGLGAPWGQECWGLPMGFIRAGSGSQVPSHSPGRSRAASGSPGQSQPWARQSGS